jgi:hypothetical protein
VPLLLTLPSPSDCWNAHSMDPSLLTRRAPLCPLAHPTPKVHSAFSADQAEDADAALYPVEFLNTLTPQGLPPHEVSVVWQL